MCCSHNQCQFVLYRNIRHQVQGKKQEKTLTSSQEFQVRSWLMTLMPATFYVKYKVAYRQAQIK